MPTYQYRCNGCKKETEQILKIQERLQPTLYPCPECNEAEVELVPAAPVIGDPVNLGVKRTPDWFTDKLKEIKKNNRGSTVKTDNTLSK